MAHRNLVVLHLSGEVDLATAPELAHRLRTALGSGSKVIVNLEQVDFMDCSGLRVLLAAAEAYGGAERISVTSGPRSVRRLFALTGAARILRVIPAPVQLAA